MERDPQVQQGEPAEALDFSHLLPILFDGVSMPFGEDGSSYIQKDSSACGSP